jgi:tRNA (uracil-5-)-methyltransferase
VELSGPVSATLADGGLLRLHYRQPHDGFSNPNAHVNQLCLQWLCSVGQELQGLAGGGGSSDLLELYCGAGNHTMALAHFFPRIFCVELNQALCAAAEVNLAINGLHNVRVRHGHSESFARTCAPCVPAWAGG